LAGAALALAAPFSVLAQTPVQPPPSAFGEQIEVRVVNVEVVVTDKDGKRVAGLQPAEFRLRVDGKDVPVEFFTEIQGRQAVAPAGGAAGQTVGTWYLVFVDDYFAHSVHRNRVLEALKNGLSRLGPDDRLAVVAYDGGRLEMLSSWSNSASDLSRAFGNAMARPARGPQRVTELQEMLRNEGFNAESTDPATEENLTIRRMKNENLSPIEKAYGNTLVHQLQAEIGAVVSAMRATSGVPGRKVLLLLSGGWPFSSESYIRGSGDAPMSRDLPEGEKIYRPLTSTANLLGYTIYPVDLPGMQGESADAGSFDFPGTSGRFREREVEGALTFLAKETGGRPLLNTAREEALDVAEEDTRSYYSLGFTPAWERNDKRHEMDVRLLRPGLTARFRNSFLDLSKKAEVSMTLESALLFGNLPDSIQMPVRVGSVARKKGGTEIPLTLALPVDAFTVVPMDGKYRAKLELRAAAADDQGNRSDVQVIPLELASDREPKPGGYVKYETKITVKGQPKHLVLATYDPLSGKIATSQVDVPAQ
jgi:VWFA-related protein